MPASLSLSLSLALPPPTPATINQPTKARGRPGDAKQHPRLGMRHLRHPAAGCKLEPEFGSGCKFGNSEKRTLLKLMRATFRALVISGCDD